MVSVLVVDDSAMDRHLAGGFVEQEDMTVQFANDGIHALQLLQENPPDIVLTDLDMPECDGWNWFVVRRNSIQHYLSS